MSGDKGGNQQQQQQQKMESKKESSGDDDQVTVEIQFAEPDLVYTITYDGGVPAQAAFDECVEKGILQFLAATGISKEEFLSHPEANLDGKTVAEWAASTNSVPRVILTTKPKNGLLAKLQFRTREAEVARKVMGAQEEVAKSKALAMARSVMATSNQNYKQVEQLKQLEKQLRVKEEQLLAQLKKKLKKKMAAEEAEVNKRVAEAKKKNVKKREDLARLVKQKQDQLVNHNTSLQKQLGETKEKLKTKEKLLQEQLDKQRELVDKEVAKQGEVFRGELDETRAGYEAEKLRLETKLQENLTAYNAERSYRDNDNKGKKLQLKMKEAEKSSDEKTITELIAVVESQGKKMVELEEKILELEKNNSELKKKIMVLEKKTVELESRVGSLEKENAELKRKQENPEFKSSELIVAELKQHKEEDQKEKAALWSAIAKLGASSPALALGLETGTSFKVNNDVICTC